MTDQVEQVFAIQRIFVKDISFEAPLGVELFSKPWKPAVNQEIGTTTVPLADDRYEVTLTVTVTGKLDEQTAFVVEVKQAGLFLIKGLNDEQLKQVLGANCPGILFPYVRELVDNLMVRGSMPPLMLPPISFDALYQQVLAQQAQQAGSTAH
ncbi:MAG TPA: protein-export chaperone SecB [Pseudomonadales bacterium]|nr:protein-export chaperone SecB [Pseudomonadales bacterium]